MVKKIIESTIREYNLINSQEHIVIGLSGGPDSVCLFSVLNELKDEMDFALYAVHVNHGFRPGDAEEDQAYVENLCEENGVPCITFSFDCSAIAKDEGLSSEEAGRKVRYDSFRKVADALIRNGVPEEKVKIAVAQNADDQAETVLLRLLRGTGPDGLAGIAYSRKEGNICVIRPLLDTWRKDIEAYCEEKNLLPRTDKTNLQPIYTRNKVRLQLIPYLQENFNPNVAEGLSRLSRIAGDDKDYLWKCAEEEYEKISTAPGILNQQELAGLAPSIRRRVIMKALKEQGLTQDVAFSHLEAAEKVLQQQGESKIAEFPNGYKMAVRYGEATFYCDDETGSENWQLNVTVEAAGENVPASNHRHSLTARFDYDKIREIHGEAKVQLRTRKEGDFLSIAGGRKKIQDLFVDMKVPKENREHVLLAAVGSEILWLPQQEERGVLKSRYGHRYKLDENTKNTLYLEIICES